MANQISISCDPKVQLHAAKAFSSILKELKINHDVIGGFALSLFGSSRHTNDVEILVDLAPNQIRDVLRPQITRINQHFVELGLKFYYVPTLVDGLAVKELVSINKGNVLIETLATNTLGLPLEADPAMIIYPGQTEEDSVINILILPPTPPPKKNHKILIIRNFRKRAPYITSQCFNPHKAEALGTNINKYLPTINTQSQNRPGRYHLSRRMASSSERHHFFPSLQGPAARASLPSGKDACIIPRRERDDGVLGLF